MLKKRVYRVKLNFITEVLGLSPASSDLYEKYIRSKLQSEIEKVERALRKEKDEEKRKVLEEKLEALQRDYEVEGGVLPEMESRVCVFWRDSGGRLCFLNYQVLGHFKEIARNYYKGGLQNKFSRYVDVRGVEHFRFIPFMRNGSGLVEADGLLQRPLRAFVRGDYVVSIAVSEMLVPPIEIEFDVWVVGDEKLHGIDGKLLREMMEYGREIMGLSQWRTGGFGRYEVLEFRELKG